MINHLSSSYRDPSGFVYDSEGVLYRQVNQFYKEEYVHFRDSGCYKHLVSKGLLIPHEEVAPPEGASNDHFITLRPEKIPFISYPYEWSFDMLKDAALLTLQMVRESLRYGMILKDATPFNVQWYRGRLIFIDSLSFEKYEEKPWVAYRQFCETFLSPLLLMHYRKQSLQQLMLAWPDGIPLDITRNLLPRKTKWSLHIYLHIHLHASVSAKKQKTNAPGKPFTRQQFLNLLTSLETAINRLRLTDKASTWSDYYAEASQRDQYLVEKKKIISRWCEQLPGIQTAADLGANEGEFSRIIATKNIPVVAADFDPYCINRLYKSIRTTGEKNIQPLIIDLANPSPAIGVNNAERDTFLSRLDADLVMGLALIHHLAIGKNIPFHMIADMFSKTGRMLIIEFVPKNDEKVQLMLSGRRDVFPGYSEEQFTNVFSRFFDTIERAPVGASGRVLFLMKRVNQPE